MDDMKYLAIEGHKTRGNEVVKILEMLGGNNYCKLNGDDDKSFYYIGDKYKNIDKLYIGSDEIKEYEIFSLEDFLEKNPYQVGDNVHIYIQNDDIDGRYDIEVAEITSMRWNSSRCKIAYKMKDINREFYKEEIKCKVDDNNTDYPEKGKYNVEKYLKLFDESEHGLEVYIAEGYDIKEIDGHFYIVKQKPTYPKTYEECCKILDYYLEGATIIGHKTPLLRNFQQLLICRDAYWKIAGEQMGLGKSWEPDWDNLSTNHEFIKINKGCFTYSSRVLVFPTEEIQNAFYDNFKNLIEKCKELL